MLDMERVVADASVIVKFFVNEEYTERALALRDAYISKQLELSEPSLMIYEVLNAVRFSKRNFTREELNMILRSMHEYEFNITEINYDLSVKITEISTKYRISIYDATYVALAEKTKSKLYTSDSKLIKAVNLHFIKHIKDFSIV
jgi:predicted nucleic acid-binding protein